MTFQSYHRHSQASMGTLFLFIVISFFNFVCGICTVPVGVWRAEVDIRHLSLTALHLNFFEIVSH